ncbi:GGDEF/EAL domain-containing response regulator [Pseudorhodoferax soli]|uniref:Diguanylate cyclase (GGDEF)-like protein n=1 Tax=Pseudorhodoferax soli TaxID=545864 RepID=A0A368Y5K8_9BURK|nr:EAL domain-containing protein [Pseudorhodoferax soli]RCW75482.1 diguanylate cyclase (GGDEF)-like protein [Pseudorhodoferax soli]
MNDQELLEFVEDGAPPALETPQGATPWRILVVDDDADVHESTAFGLRGMEIEGRPLQLLHAYSGAESVALLAREQDIAVILLDVVMESEQAGLATVDRIRGELGLAHVRIVLRTGQPGHAPEIDTIRRYDINDYKTKSELTRVKLYTALTAAIRSYDQLLRLDASRRGLEKIIEASNQFLAEQGQRTFAEGVITQIASLIGVQPEGLVCASRRTTDDEAATQYTVIAAAGAFAGLMDRDIADIGDSLVSDSLARALAERRNVLEPGHLTLFFAGRDGNDFAAFVRAGAPLRDVDARLLQVFCANIALSASNIDLLARLREYAFKDRLLDMPNRLALLQHIDRELGAGRGAGQMLALLDIDRFAETNDMFGYAYGDLLLQAIARRLALGLPPQCLLARVAGDTFGIWFARAALAPDRLAALLEPVYVVEGVARPVSFSIGLVASDADAGSGQDLFKNALIALKQSKGAGQGHIQTYTAEVGVATRERTRLLHGLQQAFDRENLFVVYQPQLALASGRVVGAEALLRWRTEDGRFISPAEFIPVAEQSGLIVPIGHWVLRTALRALVRLRQDQPDLRMAVNVSPLQFAQPQFLAEVEAALSEAALPADSLELEITESVAVMGIERVSALLGQIKARGIAVAIDDFGTGFSSLSYLDRLPADRLKIDRAFITALDAGDATARIAEMIVPLGHRLGMQVLAEGVETASQAQALRLLGCDEVQGYLYGKPMPLDAFTAWLAQRQGGA